MPTALVYVRIRSRDNLRIGVEQSVWGWRPGVARGGTARALASLRTGDYLLLGYHGPSPRLPPGSWADAGLKELVVTRLTGKAYEKTSPIWPDDIFPHRVPLEILEIRENVRADLLGAEAMEALRLSGTKQGPPVLQPTLDAVDRIIAAVSEEMARDAVADPAVDRHLDIPGDLDRRQRTFVRREQQRLRAEKFGRADRLRCALCGRTLPARLVHTAHIKRRRDCDTSERRDLANIMGACVLGCDVLFEHGYVYVRDDGAVAAAAAAATDPGLGQTVTALAGQICAAFGDDSRPYFAWHREHVAQQARI